MTSYLRHRGYHLGGRSRAIFTSQSVTFRWDMPKDTYVIEHHVLAGYPLLAICWESLSRTNDLLKRIRYSAPLFVAIIQSWA